MSREQNYTAVILKKQPFNEGDEIITLFSKERGKIRALAKSVKLSKSRLQQKLQSLFLIQATFTAAAGLPKIISAEPIKVFVNLRQNLTASKMGFYAAELVMKFTADEQKNEPLFNLLCQFLDFLDLANDDVVLNSGLAKFKIEILGTSGFGIKKPKQAEEIYFSFAKGGFSSDKTPEALAVSKQAYKTFSTLSSGDFASLGSANGQSDSIEELQRLLSGLIEYHLERKVKSEKYI